MAAAMQNRTRRREQSDVRALTKQDVLDIAVADKSLKPYQDEKLDIYHREQDDMSAAFVEAREGRGVLAKLYDQRNSEILNRLSGMMKKTDRSAKKQLDRLKAFEAEMEQTTKSKKKSWKQKFTNDKTDISARSTGVSDTITELDAAIVKEHEDCLVLAAESTEPLLNALAKHRQFLRVQVHDRDVENKRFAAEMAQRFAKLKSRLAEEEENRRTSIVEIHKKAKERICTLEKRVKEHLPEVQKSLKACRQRLEEERTMHSSAQEGLVADMTRFMEDFEESVLEGSKSQEKTKAQLVKMKEMLRRETDD